MVLTIKYKDEAVLLPGLPKNIARYEIQEGKLRDDKPVTKFSFSMKVQNDIHNIAHL